MKRKFPDLDLPETTIERIEIIKKKKFLKNTYTDFYKIFKKNSNNLPKGKKVELGSGAGFLKEVIPDIITSDVVKLPNCDMQISAEKIPFKNNSVSVFYMLNTFHHIKNPKKALSEFSRCLKKGGKVIMIESCNSPWGRFVYQNFHHETFDPKADWKTSKGGHLSSANGALPWIVFVRDRKKFEKLFSEFKITRIEPHTPFRYLVSGGFTLPQLAPSFLYGAIKRAEKLARPFNKCLGMFATIELTKV